MSALTARRGMRARSNACAPWRPERFTLAKLLTQNADHVEGHHGRTCGVSAHRSPAITSNMSSSVVVADLACSIAATASA